MRMLICGGREFRDVEEAVRVLDALPVPDLVITGGAKGADSIGSTWAKSRGHARVIFPANWEGEGKGAGYLRNKRMLEIAQPDLVVAFPGGKGTESMCRLARKAGVEVLEV